MIKIFLSHNHKDIIIARKIRDVIEKLGLKVWIDEYEISIGDSLASKISAAIGQCDYLIIIVSENSLKSNWVKKELEWALTKEINDPPFKVLPIVVNNVQIPFILSDKRYFQLSTNYSKLGLEIAQAIMHDQNFEQLPSNVILNEFEIINSAKQNLNSTYFIVFIGIICLFFSVMKEIRFFTLPIGIICILLGIYVNHVYSNTIDFLKNNRNILIKVQNIGPFKIPFGRRWKLQSQITRDNKEFKKIFIKETILFIVLGLLFLFVLIFIYYVLGLYLKI